jgi:hypothetical protein
MVRSFVSVQIQRTNLLARILPGTGRRTIPHLALFFHDFVLLSHAREDHDRGLPELVERGGAGVKAHVTYDLLVRL